MTPKHRLSAGLMITGLLGFVAASIGLWKETAAPSPITEVERLQEHFRTVEQELLARDVSHLTSAQRAARSRHIEVLHAYAESGVFPKNTNHPGRRVPYFEDRYGTLCAMGYLIAESGRSDIVGAVAAKMNNATVLEIAAHNELGPVLQAWLDEAGLTVDEAQRIQPAYNGGCCVLFQDDRITTDYAVASAVTLGASTLSSVLNIADGAAGAKWRGVLGVGSGVTGMVLGGIKVDNGGEAQTLGLVNFAVGAASTMIGAINLLSRSNESTATARSEQAIMTPTITFTPSGGQRIGLNVRF